MALVSRQTKQESIIYTIVWMLLFMAPVVEFLFNYDPQHPVWIKRGLVDTLMTLVMFLVVFLIHNYVLAPMLVKQKKVYRYLIGCVVVIALFQTVQCLHKPREGFSQPPVDIQRERPATPPPDGRPPIDKHDLTVFTIVIMMLGTNDLKEVFGKSASQIAQDAGTLVDEIKTVTQEKQGFIPKIILVSPPLIGEGMPESVFSGAFAERVLLYSGQGLL